ncbi:MAG TPA: hypothetical protein VFG50_15690 [Rhodothermales bacterium]|nr:hypothetical protein [Rhodothermales bacterium]
MRSRTSTQQARRGLLALAALTVPITLVVLFAFTWRGADPTPAPVSDVGSDVAHGAYLVQTHVCNDCHTPWKMGPNGPEPDMTRMLSGHPQDVILPPPPDVGTSGWGMISSATNTAFAGPWGISYARNLTPDPTGLGSWTEEMFVKALRTGWHMGVENSRRIMPPMPWQSFGQMTDEELHDVFLYLKSIPPIHNQVPENVMATTGG